MRNILLGICTLCVLSSSYAQDGLVNQSTAIKWSESIDSNDLKGHIFYLASDFLGGRETGKAGNERAARYAADYFQKYGYSAIDENGDYFQEIMFTKFTVDTTILSVNGQPLTHFDDFVVSPFRQKPLESFSTDQLYFAGFGLENENYSDYGKADWTGKAVIIYKRIPEEVSALINDSTQLELNERLSVAGEKGVSAVFVIHDEFNMYSARTKRYLMAELLNLGEIDPSTLPLPPHAMLSTNAAKNMVGKKYDKFLKERKSLIAENGLKGKPLKIPVDISLDWSPKLDFVESQNITAYLPGGNPQLKDEHIVVSAHMDHLGQRAGEVYNGADDNASGTSALLEVAETFAEARKAGDTLDRSILFVLMTGEEKGLLGSRFYADNPLLPLENAVANVNLDMLGRTDEKYRDSVDYVYVIGADRISRELHDINELANAKGPQLALDYTYNAEDDPNRYYYRSDHYNFAKKGIPAIFYFNGTHDDYHRISDTPDKINFPILQKRAQLIYLTIWELAQRPQRLQINESTN